MLKVCTVTEMTRIKAVANYTSQTVMLGLGRNVKILTLFLMPKAYYFLCACVIGHAVPETASVATATSAYVRWYATVDDPWCKQASGLLTTSSGRLHARRTAIRNTFLTLSALTGSEPSPHSWKRAKRDSVTGRINAQFTNSNDNNNNIPVECHGATASKELVEEVR